MPRTYTYGRGLFKQVAREIGKPVSWVKSHFMRVATQAARQLTGGNTDQWISTLRRVLPVAFELFARKKLDLTPEDIVKAVGARTAAAAAPTGG